MTAREKVIKVEQQVRSIVAGDTEEFLCPFCGETSKPENNLLCCGEAAEVCLAVLDYIDTAKSLELVDKVMNKFARMASRSILN